MMHVALGVLGIAAAALMFAKSSRELDEARRAADEDDDDETEDDDDDDGLRVRQISPDEMARNPGLLAALTPFWEQTVNQATNTGVAVTRHVNVAGQDFTLVAAPSGRATVFEGRVG